MVAAEYGLEHQYIYASLNHSGDEARALIQYKDVILPA